MKCAGDEERQERYGPGRANFGGKKSNQTRRNRRYSSRVAASGGGQIALITYPPLERNRMRRSSRIGKPAVEVLAHSLRRDLLFTGNRSERQAFHRGWTRPDGISNHFPGHDELDAAILLPSLGRIV
jgi:hypothetical protein